MPHLKRIRMKSDIHDRAEVTCIDYADNKLTSIEDFSFDGNYEKANKSFRQKVTDGILPDVQLRYLIVEDLSPKLISILGSCLGISPELFEEHLLNLGWATGTYGDPDSGSWNTRDLLKDYISVEWYRPVKHNWRLARPGSYRDHDQLQNSSLPTLQWIEKEGTQTDASPCTDSTPWSTY